MERKLSTIQKRENLNTVYAIDEAGCGGASHVYRITPNGGEYPSQDIQFQNGPRNSEDSIHGVLDTDLLEIVRDRLKGFQSGEFSCREIRLVKHPESDATRPIQETRDLGFMLYDLDYSDPKDIKPMFYRPKMDNGVIRVPHPDSAEVFK